MNKGLFFDLDGGGRSGHEKKLLKRRFRLDTKKIVFINSVLIAAPLTRLRSIFQFNRNRNPIIIVNKCDIVESR